MSLMILKLSKFFKRLAFAYMDTLILSSIDHTNLRNLIGFQNMDMRLLYRATRDGFEASSFHYRVDSIGENAK